MSFPAVAILACVGVLAFLLSYRQPLAKPGGLARLATLHGVRPLWGESEESLRNRTMGASRWPYSHPAPEFLWWARAWHRIAGASNDR
jgi:hypothetical protein